jgi:hypothetical protein
LQVLTILNSVVDLHHIDADPDSTYHPDEDMNPDPSFQIMAQTLEKFYNTLIFHTGTF